MFGNLLGIAIAAIVNALLGRFFPGHPKVTPEVLAQAQKDRADVLQSQKTARSEAESLRRNVADSVAPSGGTPDATPGVRPADPLRKHDANEWPPAGD